MSIEQAFRSRSESACELCGASAHLNVFEVPPFTHGTADQCVLICETCRSQFEHPDTVDDHHWRCLNESMWSQVPAVQVMAWRMLQQLTAADWAQDLFHMLYLDEETLAWAKALDEVVAVEEEIKHTDSNGVLLEAGDTVTLIKDLNVKGAGFTAKRGTAVRGISLVPNNPEHIEGRVSGQRIVILTKFVSKSC